MQDGIAVEEQQGSLEKGLAGDYSLNLKELLGEAWRRVDGNKALIWKAMLMYIVLAVLLSLFFGFLTGGSGDADAAELPSIGEVIGDLVTTVVLMPVGVGLVFLATAIALGRVPNPKSIFAWYDNTLRLALTYVLMWILVMIGFLLLILPGIYLAVSYQFALPLAVDKKLGPWESLEASRKVIGHRWFTVFGYNLVIAIVIAVSSLLLAIPFIWTLPAVLIAYGILYRNLVGIEPATLDRVLAEN